MDAGWRDTYDEYFDNWVQRILTSVTQRLYRQPKYTYTLGDISFFRKFYQEL